MIAGIAVGLHLVVLLTPWFWSWSAAIVAGSIFFLTAELGINIGYHRLLSHASFVAPPWLRGTLALLGSFSLQGGPITWIALHRIHHRESDRPLDPHTPSISLLWAEFLWVFFDHPFMADATAKSRLAPDLVCEPVMQFVESWHLAMNILLFMLLATCGWIIDGHHGAVSWLLLAGAVRIVATWHITFIVNAVNHCWGYRNYKTRDNSRNNVWISLLVCFGEGWHNNHHAYPHVAAHGHRWFEFDLAYCLILLLERCRLAHRVIRPSKVKAESAEMSRLPI